MPNFFAAWSGEKNLLDFIFILAFCCFDGQVMVQEGGTTIPPEPYGDATSNPKSPMGVNDNDQDEALLKLNKDELS
jgi:hypothetical protein